MSRTTDLLEALGRGVLSPLVLGGPLRPVRPLGEARAVELVRQLHTLPEDLVTDVQRARARAARQLVPVDEVRPLDAPLCLLVCALNDLLQATHPVLTLSPRRRPARLRLLDLVDRTIARAGAPRTVVDAIERHVTFRRVLSLTRLDTHVGWWSGSATFYGAPPPRRLFAWPRVRAVRSVERGVPLGRFVDDPQVEAFYVQRLLRWLQASPLGDLATAERETPPFAWSESALAVIASEHGRILAARAIAAESSDAARCHDALEQASRSLAPASRRLIEAFLQGLAAVSC